MEYIYPDYYESFRCIAQNCEDTCCAGWGIAIDNKTLKKYTGCKGSFGNRLHNSIDFKEKTFERVNRRCAFLNEDNLCDIYIEAGKDMLCKTCRRYPRHYEEFENLREISLSISCPEVARIILSNKATVTFKTAYRETGEESYEYFDFLLFTKLQEIRDLLLSVVCNRELSLEYRMSLILAECHDLQTRISKNRLFEIDDLINLFAEKGFLNKSRKRFDIYKNDAKKSKKTALSLLRQLYKMENLNKDWKPFIKSCEEIIAEIKVTDYEKLKSEFKEYYKSREYEYEQILVYFIFVYFLGAVYDNNAYNKLIFAVANTLIIREIDFAIWIKNNKSFEVDKQVEIVYKFAREIEHSDNNLQRYEKLIEKNDVYTLENLLYYIWN